LGCSCMTKVERENFVDSSYRDEYTKLNPESPFCQNIKNGEITRGMDVQEVIASWGLPNVYLVSAKKSEEYWIYYIRNELSSSVLIYTLVFSDDSKLSDWDIDMKRFIDNSYVYNPESLKESITVDRTKLKR
ncbi:MAG: hypothetical protein MUF59_08610, partial [Candidatus Krumholzibacteria bacterium]|nr:hypothetical protein [Candidatus Krumholzibacteria bacterium]